MTSLFKYYILLQFTGHTHSKLRFMQCQFSKHIMKPHITLQGPFSTPPTTKDVAKIARQLRGPIQLKGIKILDIPYSSKVAVVILAGNNIALPKVLNKPDYPNPEAHVTIAKLSTGINDCVYYLKNRNINIWTSDYKLIVHKSEHIMTKIK